MSAAISLQNTPARQVIHRTRGRSHGHITRLMSPRNLGEILKPFVFLDLFDNRGDQPRVAPPPHLELGESENLYQSAADIPEVGRA